MAHILAFMAIMLFVPTSVKAANGPLRTKAKLHHDCVPSAFKFEYSVYNVSIPENSAGKTYAFQPPNEEPLGIKLCDIIEVKYRIVGGDKDKIFKAEDRIVGDFVFLNIRTRTNNIVLNREKDDKFYLEIRAIGTKTYVPEKVIFETNVFVWVKITDTNDLSPLFYPTEYSIVIPEDTFVHKSIMRVRAEDADLGVNGEIYYSLEDTEYFNIHPIKGIITLSRPVKYSEQSMYELSVYARDRGILLNRPNTHKTQAAKAKVKVSIKQVNLFAPEIHVQALPNILENSNAKIYGIVKIEDRDEGLHGTVQTVKIVDGDPDGHFQIKSTSNKNEFVIEVNRLLDREISPYGYNLTLLAIDSGTPPKQTYKVVPVRLADANDNSPVFNRELYEVFIQETAPPNTPVIRLKVTDRDEGKNAQVFIEIVGGNEGNEFRINPESGMLYTTMHLDYETKKFYTLTVSAIDQGNTGTRRQASAKVKIVVEDCNDMDPVFQSINTTIDVNENEPAGTSVTTVVAKDLDAGENAYISYSIANLNDVPFEIDHFSGTIRTSKLLDFESMRREYKLKIRASDWGLPYRRQTEIQLTFKLRNVNDNRPIFKKIDCIGQIPRNIAIGTEILTVSAIDYDENSSINYRLVSGNEDGCFNLESVSGVISIGCDLHDVAIGVRFVNVTATDGKHFSDTMHIQVVLVDETVKRLNLASNSLFECRDTGATKKLAEILALSEKTNMPSRDLSTNDDFYMLPSRYGENVHYPEFVDLPLEVLVNETIPLGTTVSHIQARDRDLGYNGKLVYGISNGDHDSVFRIDTESGEIKIIGYLDRERRDEYLLNVTVYDLGIPQKSTSKILPITVIDENDNPPKFLKNLISLKLSESASNNTSVVQLQARDPDLGENGKIKFSLVTDTHDFSIDSKSGVLFVSSQLDRERQASYELLVRVTDFGRTPLHSDALVRIMIDDVNDTPPVFTLKEYTFSVREDIPEGTSITFVTANDYDTGPGGEIFYVLDDNIKENEVFFKIDEVSGTIKTTRSLDFEERQIHHLKVKAIDKGNPSLSSEANVTIEIIDVNENYYAPQFDDFVLTGSVLENQPPGTFVLSAAARDFDSPGPDSQIVYSIRGGDGLGAFAIDDEGGIRTLKALDLETKTHYWLKVCAQDQGVVPLHRCIPIFIEIQNVNDNIPLTEVPVYYASIPENSPQGTSIIKLLATDGDLHSEEHITFQISSGNPEGYFAIDSTTGLISTTARKLDRENQNEHILEILISDNGNPIQLSSTTRVVVEVEDVNDNSPFFEQKFYKVQVPANAVVDQPILQVLAIDRDSGENGRITYSIKSGRGKTKFRIDPETGVIHAAKTFVGILPDDEPEQYDFQVRAEDNGIPKKSQSTRINVSVRPISQSSKHAPVINTQNQNVEVTESDTPGYLLTLIQATDEDNDQLWYDIIDGDVRHEFYIGHDNGNILLVKQLDWETQQQYNLTISVTDGINTITTQFYVTVLDVNDHAPVFSQNKYIVDISENVPEGTEILKLHATDKDEDKKLYYSLHTSKDPMSIKLFKVDSISGIVFTSQSLDRELHSKHVLIVTVKDQGTPAKRNFAVLTINIIDHNDHHPLFTSKIVQGKVFETASVGTSIAQVIAHDRDFGDNAKIEYSILSGNIGNSFKIDPVMGVISLAKELGTTSLTEYMLQVRAVDCGKPSLSSQLPVHILVNLADNAPPKIVSYERVAEIEENVPIGTFVTFIEARSTSSILFEIEKGNLGDKFFINPSTGVITTKDYLDFELIHEYNLTIRATNMASVSSRCQLIISILDKNDNHPYFSQPTYRGEITELAPTGSLVSMLNESSENRYYIRDTNTSDIPLVVSARDDDMGLNALLHFEITDSMANEYFSIDSITGAIKSKRSLDFESINVFKFNVIVTDLGKPRLSSEPVMVEIFVRDENDNAPEFKQKEYNVVLLVPTFNNVIVTQVEAVDKDLLVNQTLRYDLIDGNINNIFDINSLTGVITTANVNKLGKKHKLNIRVSDGKFSSVTHVHILVEKFESSGLIFQKSLYEASIFENTSKIMNVVILNVLGTTINEQINFRILTPTNSFTIGATSGAIRTTGIKFDREEQDKYELIVEASSHFHQEREQPRTAIGIVKITIEDINDNCPQFVNQPYYAAVSIDDPKGTTVLKVTATDADIFDNGEVRYEMTKGHGELFRVDRKSGEIVLKQVIDGNYREYELVVSAFDGGIQPCSVTAIVYIKVIDKAMPVFMKQFYSDEIFENVEIYSPLSVAIQAESPLNRKLIYSIVKGNEEDKFLVDFNTGTLFVADELDYEDKKIYELVVRATDSVSGISADVPVVVSLKDSNDCEPEFERDVYNISVSELATYGIQLIKLNVSDNDTGINQVITFNLQEDSRNSSAYFHIDPIEGIIYLKRALDYEHIQSHHFTVLAKDNGVPSLTSRAEVFITVIDKNDNSPSFEQPSYSCGLSRTATRGQFVAIVSASDPDIIDQEKLIYAIVQGNDKQTFSIESKTGTIVLSNLQEFGELQQYVLNVSVTDGVYTSFTRVRINILPENMHFPEIEKSYEAFINENEISSKPIITLKAIDKDFEEFGKVFYSITSTEAQNYFSIDSEKGEIVAKSPLDRELIKVFEIPVMVTDTGGLSAFTSVKVKVLDENDNAPEFDLTEYKISIFANTSMNTPILRVRATDKDEHLNAMVKYMIFNYEDEEANDIFEINEDTGDIFLLKSAIDNENQMFQFFVRVTDKGSVPLHSDVSVNIFIMSNSDDIPMFENNEKTIYVSEFSPPGTIVTKMVLTSNMTVKYKIVSQKNNEPSFTINELGELLLIKALDREIKDQHLVVIMAETDSSPSLTNTAEVTVHVVDENDNSPVFESNPYFLNGLHAISEMVGPGTSVIKITAKDIDLGSNGDIRYSIENREDILNTFDIDSYTGWITTLVRLDKEVLSEYKFQVTATDNGLLKRSSKSHITIKLQDYNDNPTEFKSGFYNSSIFENALPGTVILQMEVHDRDYDLKTHFDFYIVAGDSLAQFQIRQTGEIYVAKPLNYEKIRHYMLKVIVTDGKFISFANVSVHVLNVNDNPPYCLKYRYKTSIQEGLPATKILNILAKDEDDLENPKLRFYLTGNGAEEFLLEKDTGSLSTAKPLDREAFSRFSFEVHVQDRDHPGWDCRCEVQITVEDANDNEPKFSQVLYTVTVPEDAAIGSLITKIHATDNDLGVNRKLKYSFIDSIQNDFEIIADSGIITLAKSLDRELKSVYNLSVQATDMGTPRLSGFSTVQVIVSDVNDNPPEFETVHYFVSINESAIKGSEVIQVHATSKDEGINSLITYSIIEGNEHKKFFMNNQTGSITLLGSLDYEKTHDYFLTIQAVDHGNPPLSNLATVNISLIDMNDNLPLFTQSHYFATIPEDAEIGDTILQLRAIDLDSTENGKVEYFITKGDRYNQFSISEHGYISVIKQLDRETVSNFVLEVTAKDKGEPPLSSSALVNIDVSDINDNPPVFAAENYTVFVQENKPIGHILMKFIISDADTAPNAAPFTFDFRSGNEMGAFRIEQDGVLRSATRFNHKVKESYSLQVRVFDNGSPPMYSDSGIITIKVIEESQYPPIVTPLEITINSYRDEFLGSRIGRVFATDQDQYDSLNYSIVPTVGLINDPTSLFNISKFDGTLYALPNLDVGSYRLNVTVTDGKFISFVIIKITVELITDDMLNNAIMIRFSKTTPEEFVLSHRKGFIRSIRNLMGTRLKDIIIISIQPSVDNSYRFKRTTDKDLDVVFTVRKHSHIGNSTVFFKNTDLKRIVGEHFMEIEEGTKLKVEDIMTTKCESNFCIHGTCVDKIVLHTNFIEPIATDVTSFVSARHIIKAECECKVGYGGDKCEQAVNDCAKNPCSQHKICVPDSSSQGYHCTCHEGFVGPNCDIGINFCSDLNCYQPKDPVSFGGKSYAQFRIEKMITKQNIGDRLSLSMNIRTLQPTGCLMFISGNVDYSILEIVNGVIQYRFDLGSGEGLVAVSSMFASDGKWHEVKVNREGNSAKVIVDGNFVSQGNAPGINGVLNLQSNYFYFGAEVVPHPDVVGGQDVQKGYIGCIDEISISEIPVFFHKTSSTSFTMLSRVVNVEFNCDSSTTLTKLGVCGSQPCFNGGSCKEIETNKFECLCHKRYAGSLCSEDLNPCASTPCLYGGKCVETNGNFTCECPAKMTGRRCDYGRYCLPNPCRNGGHCEESDDGPICMCRGYSGPTCEIDINECDTFPCGQGATCINELGSFRCICPNEMIGGGCGDPLYSGSITSKLRNVRWEFVLAGIGGIMILLSSCVLIVTCFFCRRRSKRQCINSKNNEGIKENLMSNLPKETYKRTSMKVSNIDMARQTDAVQQRPVSYTASSNNEHGYPSNAVMQYNNLHGSADDDLEKLPNEYKKLTKPNPNLNCGATSSDNDSLNKQKWCENIQLQTFSDNKIVNDLSNHGNRSTLKVGILPGRLNSPSTSCSSTINQTLVNSIEEPSNLIGSQGAYHWDCSDWIRRSQNTLSNITEVPGSEIRDSSSMQSQESIDTHYLPFNQNIRGPFEFIKEADALEEKQSEQVSDFVKYYQNNKPLNVDTQEVYFDEPCSNSVPSDKNLFESYLRHPNSYLPVPKLTLSETENDSIMQNNNFAQHREVQQAERATHQIIESDDDGEDDIPSYGFPMQIVSRNRRYKGENSNKNLGENNSLLEHYIDSSSDISTNQLWDLDDREEETSASDDQHRVKSLLNVSKNNSNSTNNKKSVKWNNNVQHTDV